MLVLLSISAFFSFLLGKLTLPLLSKLILDIPNKRSSHTKPKPTGGGIFFVLPVSILSLIFKDIVPLFVLPLSFLALIDDRLNISSFFRYISQIFTVFILLKYSNLLELLSTQYKIFPNLIYLLIILIFGTAIINFINFMDGIDGLVAGGMLITYIFILNINFEYYLLFLIGALIPFIYFNWSPSKVFMGDVGSTFLASLYLFSIFNTDNLEFSNLSILIMPLSPFWLDCISCIIRRFRTGQNIFSAHKLHLYQRLNQSGLSHAIVASLYIFIILIFGLITLLKISILNLISLIVLLIFGVFLDKYVAKPFKVE